MTKMKTVINWSSGKDAAHSYYLLQQSDQYEVTSLLTTINQEKSKVVMHGVREELLDLQAAKMNLPLYKVLLPAAPDDGEYKSAMHKTWEGLKEDGVVASAFGDIHLDDLKQYREQQLSSVGMKGVFPLWGKKSRDIVMEVEHAGIEAVIVCVNEESLGREFLGRKIDSQLLSDLPSNVDPCGEYGEFHTFVYNAPFFSSPVDYRRGEVVQVNYPKHDNSSGWDSSFLFLDILPAE